MSTQQAHEASKKIVRDTIRDGLRSATSDGSFALQDPLGSNRSADTEFILTSFPSRDPEYPHIVVEEQGMSGGRLDSRVDLNENDFDVRARCFGRSTTEAMNLRDQVREWFQASYETLRDAGYTDVELVSTNPIEHESDVSQKAFQLTYTGNLYTTT